MFGQKKYRSGKIRFLYEQIDINIFIFIRAFHQHRDAVHGDIGPISIIYYPKYMYNHL